MTDMERRLVVIAATVLNVFGFPYFRDRIPNGYSVPNPCLSPAVWNPVGHYNPVQETFLKNPFGLDFKANNYTWTRELCMKDSDHDHRTNGEELGDPGCVWKNGTSATTKAVGHPGICEPVGSQQCNNQHFKCDCLEKCKETCKAINNEPKAHMLYQIKTETIVD